MSNYFPPENALYNERFPTFSRRVGRALALMHDRPAESWSIERLGEEAGLSRAALHERFVHFIGQPPMQYLAAWRMQLAAAWRRSRRNRARPSPTAP